MTSMIVKLARLKAHWSNRYEYCAGLAVGKDGNLSDLEKYHIDRHGTQQHEIGWQLGLAASLFKAETIDDAVIHLCRLAEIVDLIVEVSEVDNEDDRAIRRLTYSIFQVLQPLMQTRIEDTGYADCFDRARDPWLDPLDSLVAYKALVDGIDVAEDEQ